MPWQLIVLAITGTGPFTAQSLSFVDHRRSSRSARRCWSAHWSRPSTSTRVARSDAKATALGIGAVPPEPVDAAGGQPSRPASIWRLEQRSRLLALVRAGGAACAAGLSPPSRRRSRTAAGSTRCGDSCGPVPRATAGTSSASCRARD